ncbi:hypothetical protein AB3M83_11070 [Microbacterium sp. 179-B 1A2 NHS]|uniref:hypothetical protein n=1 Tax=Microbacterium sp. 179-B 1A2 NHS TaxID=3142383 RepID=UPI00399EF9BB
MKGFRRAGLATSAAVLLLCGCAATPEVDLDAAREWLDTVAAESSDGPGDAGTAGMRIGPATGGDRPDDGIRLDYEAPTQVVRVDARCFGGDGVTAEVTITVFPAEQSSSSRAVTDIPCDREAHGIAVDTGPAEAIRIDASADAETYLHATVIQELVVER